MGLERQRDQNTRLAQPEGWHLRGANAALGHLSGKVQHGQVPARKSRDCPARTGCYTQLSMMRLKRTYVAISAVAIALVADRFLSQIVN
jgi:hypothetical protein